MSHQTTKIHSINYSSTAS